MSYQEKSIWVSLFVTILCFGFYFTIAYNVFKYQTFNEANLIGLFIITIILVTVIQSTLQSILALTHLKEADQKEDERDHLIELKATRFSYFVLVFGVWIAGTSILILSSPLAIANIIMFFFILGEIVGFSTQLFHYRRGI